MRILLTATVVALALPMLLPPPATADVAIWIEDFEENGEPGFDPRFGHLFSCDSGGIPWWEITDGGPWRPDDPMLFLGARDTIGFSIQDQSVVYASVEIYSGIGGATVTFIGADANVVFTDKGRGGYRTYGISSTNIGEISEIQLWSYEGYFDNVTLHVVPEPSLVISMILLGVFVGIRCLLIKRRVPLLACPAVS